MDSPISAGTRLRVARVLWGALLISVALFYVVVKVMRPDPNVGLAPHLDQMLAIAAVLVAVTSVVLPRIAFVAGLKQLNLRTEERQGEPVGGFRESAPVTRFVADPDEAILRAFGAYQSAFLVGMALAESIALFGFVLEFLGGSVLVASGYFVVAVALMATKFPRLTTIKAAIERATNARFP
jgi:hypothetical protein